MKKIILLSFIAIFSLGMAHAQDVNQQSEPINGAKIVFASLEHQYGTIRKGGDGTCVCEFVNEGNEPLILSSVRSSCGCTTPSWTKAPIMPGSKGQIRVRYDTNRVGGFMKTITVKSNSVENPSLVLRIRGTVENSK